MKESGKGKGLLEQVPWIKRGGYKNGGRGDRERGKKIKLLKEKENMDRNPQNRRTA